MRILRDCAQQAVLCELRYPTTRKRETGRGRIRGKFVRTIRDIVLIVLAWIVSIGIFIYPIAQIVAVLACTIALLFGADGPPLRRDFSTTGEVQIVRMSD
jgi:hypothetical protein